MLPLLSGAAKLRFGWRTPKLRRHRATEQIFIPDSIGLVRQCSARCAREPPAVAIRAHGVCYEGKTVQNLYECHGFRFSLKPQFAGVLGGKKLPATLAPVMRTLGLSLRVMLFLVIGTLSLGYLFTYLGEADVRGNWGTYSIRATFTNASGLKPGSIIEIAGVPIGQVTAITLDGTRSEVTLRLRGDIRVQQDAIASIQTKGLLGDRYVVITPGASDHIIKPGGKMRETESPLDLPGLLSAYVNSRQKKATPPSGESPPQP